MNEIVQEDAITPKEPGKPVASLVLGIIGLVVWIIPLIGLPVTITGLIFGVNACKRERKGLAIAGTIICAITLVFTVANSAWGAYLGATGQHEFANQFMGE